VPTHPKWEQMSEAVCQAVQSAFLQTRYEEALKKAARDVDRIASGQ
jgi:hypothetical protein